ncbi:MAG: hypothetical protein M3319_16785 [Actinomycetota bacterium]|nr:hypothetical protein [Actinomycetota bacterium]
MTTKARKLQLGLTLAIMLAVGLAVPAGAQRSGQLGAISQRNRSAQIGGDCRRASCDQFNLQSNRANIDQDARIFRDKDDDKD